MHRCIDDIFLTSNQSLHVINEMLDEVNHLYPNIKLVRQIGTTVSFLDIRLENRDGSLTTSMFHKEAAEPYIVPFNAGHPRHVVANIIENALLRTVRYSSMLSTFSQIDAALQWVSYDQQVLFHSYPARFIHNRFVKFFKSSLFTSTSLLLLIDSESYFAFVRWYALETPTISEHQIASRMARAAMNSQDYDAANDPLVRAKIKKKIEIH